MAVSVFIYIYTLYIYIYIYIYNFYFYFLFTSLLSYKISHKQASVYMNKLSFKLLGT